MSELIAFVHLGFRHITDLAALDHILFLLALAAIYRGPRLAGRAVGGHRLHRRPLGHAGARRHRRAPAADAADRVPDPGHDRGDGAREHPGAPARARAARRRLPAGVRRRVRAGARRRVRELPAEPLRRLDRRAAARLQRRDRAGAARGAGAGRGWPSPGWTGRWPSLRSPEATPSVLRLRVVAVSAVVVLVAAEMAASRAPW